jgi:hypothetical protein
MLSRFASKIARPLLGGAALIAIGGVAVAQMRPPMEPGIGFPPFSKFDPAQLPEFKGKVAQYTLTPRGMVDGLILSDGTEVKLSPWLSAQITFSIKPGDQVVIHGLKARNDAMIVAATIANPANGAVIGDAPERPHPGDKPSMQVAGKVRAVLHNMRGDVHGALLEDGTTIRLPPPEANKFPELLKVGASLAVRGFGSNNALGKSVWAMEIGASDDNLTRVMPPHEAGHNEHGMHGPMHGPGPDAPPPPR